MDRVKIVYTTRDQLIDEPKGQIVCYKTRAKVPAREQA